MSPEVEDKVLPSSLKLSAFTWVPVITPAVVTLQSSPPVISTEVEALLFPIDTVSAEVPSVAIFTSVVPSVPTPPISIVPTIAASAMFKVVAAEAKLTVVGVALTKLKVAADDVISPPLTAISPAVVILPVEPTTSKLVKLISAVVPKMSLSAMERELVKLLSVRSMAVVNAAPGVIKTAPVASTLKLAEAVLVPPMTRSTTEANWSLG